ncbi:hydrogenase maturation protease [Antrihabitans sp. YC2-6]|uniref:hydrogenase maturation protease n=1 Tax=Antrihabitans sp. YC2-6 TaxID=2799498 RepID=UPI0027DD436F|nr:hydrogenase maturation protease [Antrihabitans sp. YC2-6]
MAQPLGESTPDRRILVAGIGNIFLRDDGFGPEVLRRLVSRDLPEGVRAVDFGIRGVHLAYELLDGWDGLVLVDAVPNRGAPGTVRAFEVNDSTNIGVGQFDAHAMDPGAVFASLRALGGELPPTVVVGCQVESVDEGIGLSQVVRDSVETAVDAVFDVVERMVAGCVSESPAK